MRIVELDASGWKDPLDFLEALKTALGSCHGHGASPDAFVDSMIWGGMNSIEPPYTVKIINTAHIPKDVTDYIRLMISIITEARAWRYRKRGDDVEVSMSAPELMN